MNAPPTNLAGASTPEVHAGAQADRQDIERGPVNQVQVEVVLELGRIQHLMRWENIFFGLHTVVQLLRYGSYTSPMAAIFNIGHIAQFP